MNREARLAEIRDLFLSAPETEETRLIAVLLSVSLALVVLWLVRRRALQEEYTPIWLGVAGALMLVSIRFDLLRALTRALGAWTTSSTIFFLGELFLIAICLNYAVRLSQSNIRQKNLAQEVALLRTEVQRLSAAARGSGDRSGLGSAAND